MSADHDDWQHQMAMLAMENSHESIYWLDIDGRILYVNPAAERELGYSAAELKQMHVADLDPNVPPEKWGKDRAIARMHNTTGGFRNLISQHRHRDGRLIPVEVNSSPFDFQGVQYSIAICRDITERLAHEEALRREKDEQAALIRTLEETRNQLLQSEKLAAIGQLAAGVAHEINNPVGFVRSNLTTLRDYAARLLALVAVYEEREAVLADDPDYRARLAGAKQAAVLEFLRGDLPALIAESIEGADRVRRIVQDLRDFSRAGDNTWQCCDLHACLDSTLNMVWNEIKYKAELIRDYGTLPKVECIPSRLNQVFMNLLVNAAQAIDKHGRITVTTRPSGTQVEIAVSDTGHGISEEVLPKIFDPFFTTKPVGKGTGLGLAVSYGIVQQHGGRIEVTSRVGEGTTFTVHLPIDHGCTLPDSQMENSEDVPRPGSQI